MALASASPEEKKKAAAYMREWSARNKDRVRTYKHNYYHNNPEARTKIISRSRERELTNPEEKRERQRRYYQNNIEKERKRSAEKAQQYRETHPDKVKTTISKWRLGNKDKIRGHQQVYREKRRTELTLRQHERNTKTILKINKEDIINWESRLCGICGLLIEGRFHIDHKIPLKRGGLHVLENLQLAHPFCNLSKRDKLQNELNS